MEIFIGVTVMLFCLIQVHAKIEFLPNRHEIRLHYNAPPDLLVTNLKAHDPDNPNLEISYSLHEVEDYRYFRIVKETGALYTKRHVYLKVDKVLTIMVVAYGPDEQQEAALQQMKIRIVEYNRQTPVFEFDIYRSEVSYTIPLNVSVLRVQAKDDDSMATNAELYYTLMPSNYSDHFEMDLNSGELRLTKKLAPNIGFIKLGVLVEDGGSPMRSARANIEITVKTITEPQRIRSKNPTGETVDICWNRPLIGYVIGYLIRFREDVREVSEETSDRDVNEKNSVREVNVTSQNFTFDGSGLCVELKGLRPWTDYQFRLYAWNKHEMGLGSNVTRFTTRSNFCLTAPCQHGRCIPINGEPGFICDCDRGFYGLTCSLFNPCVVQPCGEFGICHNTSDRSYSCHCQEGFSGVNCSFFNPCTIKPPPCANGGVCESDAPNTFRCYCQTGYYGRTCEFYNPCTSTPCMNGGSCQNVSHDHYRCHCLPGFQGKRCEFDIDECISNPCFNGATCIDLPNGYYCLCQAGFTGPFCTDFDYCKEERTRLEYATFFWRPARMGEIVEVSCPSGAFDEKQDRSLAFASRSCISRDNRTLSWTAANTSRCKAEGFQIAEKVSVELEAITSVPSNITVVQFEKATQQIENVVGYALYDSKIAQSMLTVISNMLEVNNSVLEVGKESSETTGRIVDVIRKFTSEVVIDKGEKISFQTDNLAVEAISYNADPRFKAQGFSNGITFEGIHTNSKTFIKHESSISEVEDNEIAPRITVPNEALEMARSQNMGDVRVQFISFKNAKFFRSKNLTMPLEDNQKVMIASISNSTISNLSIPVYYTMPSLGDRPQLCGYWKESEKTWAFDGLRTNYTGNLIICESTHMTAFSVLLDPDPNFVLEDHHKIALSIITYVGCALSIIGLSLTILTYSIFRCLNRDRSGKILLSLCISMWLLNVVFIIGSQSHRLYYSSICVSVAILIHYFLLSTLCWMCVEAINMYQMLIHVFASSETRFMLKRCIGAWGLPLLIVGIPVGMDISYYENSNEYCMLSPRNPYVYYISFLGPSCIILLINSIVFIMVSRVLFQPKVSGKLGRDGRSRDKVTVAQVRGAFTVMTLLGITWVFGALAVGPAKVAFQYIFCILNSLQGFLIFIVRCVQYPEAKAAWVQFFQNGTLKKHRGGMLMGTSSHSNSNGSKALNYHSQSSRTASADTSSSAFGSSTKDRKISVSSLVQMFRPGSRPSVVSLDRKPSTLSNYRESTKKRRASDGYYQRKRSTPRDDGKGLKSSPEKPSVPPEDTFSQRQPSIKEGRDTQWQYYCCSMKKPEEFQKELEEAQKLTSAPLLSINPDDLPFIEDEPQEQTRKTENASQSDQGYSSQETSPNSSRILAETDNKPNTLASDTNVNPPVPNLENESSSTVEEQPEDEVDDNRSTLPLDVSLGTYYDDKHTDELREKVPQVPAMPTKKPFSFVQSKSLVNLNFVPVQQPWRSKKLKNSRSVPALVGIGQCSWMHKEQVPLIVCSSIDGNVDIISNFDDATPVPNSVENQSYNSVDLEKNYSCQCDSLEDFVQQSDLRNDLPSKDCAPLDRVRQDYSNSRILNSPKYNDALTVDSTEDISYMDSSSVEGENILLYSA